VRADVPRTVAGLEAIRGLAFLLAEVEYRAKSAEGKLRHPLFKGIREGPMSWSEALLWGTVIVAGVLGVPTAAYFLTQYFMFD
jgi:hypothetical protein